MQASSNLKKLAILCAGLDSIHRGYETHSRRLFEKLKNDHPSNWEIFLVKRDGPKKENEFLIPVPGPSFFLIRLLGHLRGDSTYWFHFFFSLAFLMRCFFLKLQFDRIYTPEPMVAKTLSRLKFLFPNKPEVLFMHGVWMSPTDYIHFGDRIQEVGIDNYKKSKASFPNKPISLLPHFDEKLSDSLDSISLKNFRIKHGLGDGRIILNVGVVGRIHKRTDYLIRELEFLPKDWVLLICGSISDPTILQEGKYLLGNRLRHALLSREEMVFAYQASSLFIHCAITEGFGMVIMEAMKYGLPLLVHDNSLFQWIVKDPEQCLNMEKPQNLSSRINQIVERPQWLQMKGEKNQHTFSQNFSWDSLKTSYHSFLFN